MNSEDVGAGTGAAARDMGEEGTTAGLDVQPGSSELTDDAATWTALEGDAPVDEAAAGGPLRDERARE